MAIDLRQGLRLNQQLLMTPQLQQAIRLLQLSRLELEQFVSAELAENPCLEEGQLESSEESMQVEKERESTEEQIISQSMQDATNLVDATKAEKAEVDWESFAQQYQDNPIPSSAARSNDEEQPNYENMVSRASTLNEHIMKQIGELDFSPIELEIATIVVGNLDDKGYLTLSGEEICALSEDFDTDTVEGVVDTIQRLDPVGVASRDLKECLLAQLRALNLRNGVVEKIVENHLTELETKNFVAISKAMKLSLDVVIQNVQIIAELEPVPARQFGGDQTQYVVPDVYVFKLSGEWVVSLNEEGLPQLRVSDIYQKMVKKSPTATGEEKSYISEKVKSAQWLIKSIQQRQRTIFRVTESIVKRQLEFFDKGVEHLRPMILKDIAEDIGMHESTISRVTNNKYVHTPRGIFELKYFFNSSVARSDGLDVASESVKRMIAEIIKVEDTKRPLSDQTIVEMLEEKGIQLARRTVAKYREQLNILPSSKRKKYF
jgi:RNA polymerase sigma-54 factor